MSWDTPKQGGEVVFKYDNVIHWVAAHSLGQMLEKNGVGLLCVYVCVSVKKKETEKDCWGNYRLRLSRRLLKSISTQSLQPLTQTQPQKAVKTPFTPSLCQYYMLAQKSVSACYKYDTFIWLTWSWNPLTTKVIYRKGKMKDRKKNTDYRFAVRERKKNFRQKLSSPYHL